MILGFTGTRYGMTSRQKEQLERKFRVFNSSIQEFHHGDCIESDETAHNLFNDYDRTIIHPPIKTIYRAYCKAKTILSPKNYLPRNDDIVQISHLIIATPQSMQNTTGGTWYTIKKATKEKKQLIIITPEGECWE